MTEGNKRGTLETENHISYNSVIVVPARIQEFITLELAFVY
jgi:hypothetical protein